MFANNYAWEKFHVAVDTLASGTEDIHTRLADACTAALIRLKIEDLPADLHEEYEASVGLLRKHLSSGVISDEITDDMASDIAQKIVGIYDALAQAMGAQDARDEMESNKSYK